ncbi:methyltransferase domain-containing protein [Kitasatospora atroaurantiaca]|uniref:Methyltransferase family protein n=1 Tax=Kitasatospora atroaurantiaca TaxID=285545 RepID=A0A561EM41_9ACTN|nr:methyltransferase domain-containing protein [Kitasatospora atroaurantiaca]TWE16686.1 methyltransferase family protein [Kitasatospora atroaurantiaca]
MERQGGLRNLVRQELVTRQLTEQLDGLTGLRVLDVGCGQGTQALRLARAGHVVTGLDPDPVTLGAAQAALAAEPPEVRQRVRLLGGDGHQCGRWFGPRSFDVVLCHGVLMYLPDPDPMLASLARMLAPGGLLSLLVRNADALAMRPGLTGDWRTALHAFDSSRYTNRLGLPARADRLTDLATTLSEVSVPLRDWYGVRVFTDNAPEDAAPVDGRQLAQLLDAEERAGREDPYRQVAALLHVVGVK